jgi:hypothetical protein
MPRVTLYVSDDLKARMDTAGEAVNWSAVAQRAFLEAVLARAVRKDASDMTNVVERLRVSKERVEARDHAAGKARGAMWAKQDAEYDELQRVAEYDGELSDEAGKDHTVLMSVIDPENEKDPRDWPDIWGQREAPTDAFIKGFIEGATEVFDEVADQL